MLAVWFYLALFCEVLSTREGVTATDKDWKHLPVQLQFPCDVGADSVAAFPLDLVNLVVDRVIDTLNKRLDDDFSNLVARVRCLDSKVDLVMEHIAMFNKGFEGGLYKRDSGCIGTNDSNVGVAKLDAPGVGIKSYEGEGADVVVETASQILAKLQSG